MAKLHASTAARLSAASISDIQVAHGGAVRILAGMGFSSGIKAETFNHYIKSLRKIGVPFAYGEHGVGSVRRVRYSYDHLMELSLILSLRTYGSIPDPVLTGIITHRQKLYSLYRRAYTEQVTGLGAPVTVTAKGRRAFELKGVFLDLKIRFASGRVIELGAPRILSPFEALQLYAKLEMPSPAHCPFNLSTLAAALVRQARILPSARGADGP